MEKFLVLVLVLFALSACAPPNGTAAKRLTGLTISPTTSSVAQGATKEFTAIAGYSDGTVSDATKAAEWSATNGAVALGANGKAAFSPSDAGNTEVTASLKGMVGTAVVTVTAAVLQSIVVTCTYATLNLGGPLSDKCNATGNYDDRSSQNLTSAVVWTTDTPAVATVGDAPANKGTVSAVSAGSAVISATLNGVAGSFTITVSPAALTSIAIGPMCYPLLSDWRLA